MITQLFRILKEAIRQVPAMKYALAVAGILAVVALAGAFRISPQVAVFGAVIILVLMVAMVVFARLTKVGPKQLLLPAQVMMWSFLLVTVATAFLLFTCTFFRWPKSLDELTGRGGSVTNGPAGPTISQTGRVRELIAGAQRQRGARDYAGAWNVISEAVSLSPDFKEARTEQVEIALAWLRDMRVSEPATFTETVRPLVECLYLALPEANETRAADIHAHIGWANALKWREGVRGQKIEAEYKAAVKLDPTNPYARAMWGHWLATQWKPLQEIQNHFDLAWKSGRAPEFVAWLQIYALGWDQNDPERAWAMIRLADQLRRKHIEPGEEARDKIFAVVYNGRGRSDASGVVSVLAGPEHFATFLWVTQGQDLKGSVAGSYFQARLTEASGDHPKALVLYRGIDAEFSPFKAQIEAGIARCQK